jgi:uncharacterized protein YbjT (DUF2867 family)
MNVARAAHYCRLMTTFLILGGTGKVGRRLSARLTELGHTARIASRSPVGTRFDWHDPDTYDAALQDVDAVFIVGPGSASDWTPQLNEFLSRAAAVGVAGAVLLSARAVEFLPDGVVGRVEQAFSAGPLPGTIIRPAHFAQNFTEAMFVPRNGQIVAPVGVAAHPFIDVRDIADVAARLLVDGGHKEEVIELSGPRALGFRDIAAILRAVSGKHVEYVPENRDAHVKRLRDTGTPETYITWRMAMLDAIAAGRDAYVSAGTQHVLGRDSTPLEQWARVEVTAACVL